MTSRHAIRAPRFWRKAERGLNLTELAIVLCIFGLISGGIWSVTSIVKENARRERAFEQVTLIVKNVRGYFQSQANSQLSGLTDVAYTSTLATRSVIPPDMIRDHAAKSLVIDHPWDVVTLGGNNSGVLLCDAGAHCTYNVDAAYQSFALRLKGIPYGACIALLNKITGPGGPSGLVAAYVNNTTTPYDASSNGGYPVPMSWAKGKCLVDAASGTAKNEIAFVFRLRAQTM